MHITDQLEKKLKGRIEDNNLRQLKLTTGLTDFVSNDYLGLAHSADLANKIDSAYRNIGSGKNGSTGSRLLSGNSSYALELEDELKKIFKAPKALLFNSGYMANLALLSSVPQKGDTIIYDEFIHACIKEGARLNLANHFSFKHNDLSSLEKKVAKASGNIFIIIESIYSMDGDQAPLTEIIEIAKKYQANIIIDEAHTTGIMGDKGNGLSCMLGVQENILARIHTFGKGMGVHGACIVSSSVLIDYLINFARAFIYTTALPLHSLVSIRKSFDFLCENIHLQSELNRKVSLFRKAYYEQINNDREVTLVESNCAIQALIVSGNEKVKQLAFFLQNAGFDVRPILSPTVKEGQERLRICLHTYNTDNEIKALVKEIGNYIL